MYCKLWLLNKKNERSKMNFLILVQAIHEREIQQMAQPRGGSESE